MYTSCFVQKFNNAVLVYSCLIPNSSNNVEGLDKRHFFRVLDGCVGNMQFDLFTNPMMTFAE